MFDDPLLDLFRHALHRSRVRAGILLALLRLNGPATKAELARLVRTDGRAIRGALHGDEIHKHYRVADALVVLGLVARIVREDKILYELTPLGAAVARALQRETLIELGRTPRVRA